MEKKKKTQRVAASAFRLTHLLVFLLHYDWHFLQPLPPYHHPLSPRRFDPNIKNIENGKEKKETISKLEKSTNESNAQNI